jgi:oligoendopeptidase F
MTRDATDNRYKWDLSVIFKDKEEWEKSFLELEQTLSKVEEFQGKLAEGVSQVFNACQEILRFRRELERLYTYAHLLSDEDTSNPVNLGLLDRATNLYSRFSAKSSFFVPELLALDQTKIKELLAAEQLKDYQRMLNDIFRFRPHTLSTSEERIVAQGAEVISGSKRIFSQLNNADLQFGEIEKNGEKMPLTHGTFMLFLKDTDREIRKRSYEQYYSRYSEHKNTLAATLTTSLKADVYYAKIRNYNSALEQALFADNVPHAVYDNLISSVHTFLPALNNYYVKRKQLLGLSEQALFDTHLSLVSEVKIKISYEEATEILREAFLPLGEEYVSVLYEGLTKKRWVDVYENPGKRSGAYSSGCYDTPPYMLMNYHEESLNDLFTLAHEAGHSMHSYYSRKAQSYQDSDYTIFVAEVASTLNEQLLLSYLRKRYSGDQAMLRYLNNHQLDEIKGTLYRQTMFAEFEKETHARLEKNESLTVQTYEEIYTPLIKKYFGESVSLASYSWLECFRIPHFYSAFYVYKYATGISAAISLAENIKSGDKESLKRYMNFLNSGCTKFPIDLLKDAGVDLSTPQPIEKALRVFEGLVGELSS